MKSSVKFKYELGVNVKDRVSGLSGIIDMRAEFLNGCIRYSVQPPCPETDKTKRPESLWIDEAQLEFLDDGLNKKPIKKSKNGGPVESSALARL